MRLMKIKAVKWAEGRHTWTHYAEEPLMQRRRRLFHVDILYVFPPFSVNKIPEKKQAP